MKKDKNKEPKLHWWQYYADENFLEAIGRFFRSHKWIWVTPLFIVLIIGASWGGMKLGNMTADWLYEDEKPAVWTVVMNDETIGSFTIYEESKTIIIDQHEAE